MRWVVERSRDQFETVTADTLAINPESLVFRTGNRMTLAIATGQWITVFEEDDAP